MEIIGSHPTLNLRGCEVLGRSVLDSLRQRGFPLCCWSRSAKEIDGVPTFHGRAQLEAFLDGTQVLINLLPVTPNTRFGLIHMSQ